MNIGQADKPHRMRITSQLRNTDVHASFLTDEGKLSSRKYISRVIAGGGNELETAGTAILPTRCPAST
jgi:hypothetical protein